MARTRAPKLTSPAERRKLARDARKRNYEPALAVLEPALAELGITRGDRRWADVEAMLHEVAANYRLAVAAEAEETPAGQIATLKAARQRMKAQKKQGMDPSPFFEHPCDDEKPRHRAALPMRLEMAIAAELRAIELATPKLTKDAKQFAAIDAAIARLDASRRNKGKSVHRAQASLGPARHARPAGSRG